MTSGQLQGCSEQGGCPVGTWQMEVLGTVPSAPQAGDPVLPPSMVPMCSAYACKTLITTSAKGGRGCLFIEKHPVVGPLGWSPSWAAEVP